MRRGHSATTSPVDSRRTVSPVQGWLGLVGDTALLVVVTAVVVAFYAGLVALVVELWVGRNDMSLRVIASVFALLCVWPLARGVRRRMHNRHQVDLDLIAAEQLEARRAALKVTSRSEVRTSR